VTVARRSWPIGSANSQVTALIKRIMGIGRRRHTELSPAKLMPGLSTPWTEFHPAETSCNWKDHKLRCLIIPARFVVQSLSKCLTLYYKIYMANRHGDRYRSYIPKYRSRSWSQQKPSWVMVGYGQSQIWLCAHLCELFLPILFSGHAERLFTRLHVNTDCRTPTLHSLQTLKDRH